MLKKKYFQTMLERKDDKTIFCNTLHIFYKGIGIVELYIDKIDPDVVNMSPTTRKNWAWDEYNWMVEDMRPDVLEDDEYYPLKTLSRKELKESLIW